MKKDELIGKKIVIFFNDTSQSVAGSVGILTGIDNEHYILDGKKFFPKDKTIRLELKEDDEDGKERT
ncbi:hypothetical protein MUP35_01920 [Patescibacteria group bacterium]|nr:hypothetical protein [Patescibacteria group bacterium]